jgi:hypothetical protein
VLLVIAVAVTAAFFVSFWGRNAEGLGAHDMGVALALSFAVPITLYASLATAALALIGAALARAGRRPCARWLLTFGVALLPGLFLFLVDLL